MDRLERLLQDAHDALQKGNLMSANIATRKILKSSPNHQTAMIIRAKLEKAELQFDTALSTLKAILDIGPEKNILTLLLEQFVVLEDHFSTVSTLKLILQTDLANTQYQYQLGLSLARIGRFDEALASYKKCLNDDTIIFLHLNIGHANKAKGNSKEAAQNYHDFIRTQPDYSGYGYWSLADLKDYQFDSEDNHNLQQLHSISKPASKDSALLGFALAKAYEQRKDYAAAFSNMSKANAEEANVRPFNKQGYVSLVRQLCEYQPAKVAKTSISPTVPIFIVGMPRSGTTLTEQILASHDQVSSTDELPFIERIAIQMTKGKSYTQSLNEMTEQKRQRFSTYFFSQTQNYFDNNPAFLIDKNPNNFLHLSLIFRLFPDAKVINLMRDPMDNIVSMYKQHFSKGNDYAFSIESIINYMQGYLYLMQHWTKHFEQGIYHLNYADLVSEPNTQIRKLLSFCNLPFQQQCIEFYRSDRPVLTPSASQVRQPINKNALKSGMHYSPFLERYMPAINNLRVLQKTLG
jgi:tetratricopeptide (TPR) repeat protein